MDPKRISLRLAVGVVGLVWSLVGSATAADVVMVVAAESPVTALDAGEVADIFLGRALRFPDGELAVPIDQPEGSAARDAFYAAFTGKSAAQLKAHWSKVIFTGRGQPPRQVADGLEAKKLLVGNPRAVAYIESSEVDETVRVLATAP